VLYIVDILPVPASELEAIKSMFHEKEKELVTAVSKVDDLTKQLDELRMDKNGSSTPTQNAQTLVELEKLRKELVVGIDTNFSCEALCSV
jgi:hypothetical protein